MSDFRIEIKLTAALYMCVWYDREYDNETASCPNIFSIACTKIKWFCPNIYYLIFCAKMAIWKIIGGLQTPPPPLHSYFCGVKFDAEWRQLGVNSIPSQSDSDFRVILNRNGVASTENQLNSSQNNSENETRMELTPSWRHFWVKFDSAEIILILSKSL